ncbi:hypothetical protein Pmar_PMAR019514 [Perkinsus marinus ATCC 50983]|uniref:ATP-grasp domain-containing protein n=1 Tax=Perkinsus marinus (strain ATCC 50983 / TXsc) TaxID=423536 RepID=C5KR84_PERM5|nr:hypothetical protein Pmar_PMAR019514 [Perkinsus marinus ATCC 50983]EER12985.1 hypothetical protein Pmar_PMAR019514 [Perkinsus marinus ATCC 50983]|eukprot:XP_002781190.1 hypothetical protein Pmar_PMAR019514 [Perkinsus marinus ATCC 50983]
MAALSFMLAARHAAMTAGTQNEPLLAGHDPDGGSHRVVPDPDAQAREMQRISSAAAKKTLLISAIIIAALFLAKWTIQFEIHGPMPDILQHQGYLRRYAAALSTSTLSSPISVSEEGIAGQKKKKEIILIGGSLGKRTMIKKHLQNHFPDVQEVWISPHDIYRNARVVTSPQGRVDGGPPGRTYAVPSNQVSANGVVDYSGVLDSLEKDLITRSQTAEILGVVPMLDAFVPFADRICAALGLPYCGNNPLTTEHRTDKALMQKCLAAKGLRHCESRCFTSAAQALEWRRPTKEAPLVVKPANSGGCDGVSVCVAEEEVRDAFDDNMYRVNAERLTNEKMVVQEYLGALEEEPMRTSLRRKRAKPGDNCDDLDSSSSGVAEAAGRSCRSCYEFIVNTVSTDGHHLVSDIWRGTPKAKPGSTECLYDIQESVSWSECPRQVLNYAFQVLDATGVRNGAAHTELMLRGEDVCLIEVNARIAGEVRGGELES